SHHTGYVILLQVSVWWCAGTAMFTFVSLAGDRARALRPVVQAALTLVLIGFSAMLLFRQPPNPRLTLITKWVGIRNYVDKVDEFMPRGASVWGTGLHGIDSPGRLELVEFVDGVNIIWRTRQKHLVDSLSVAPQYLLWDYALNRDNTLQAQDRSHIVSDRPKNIFRHALDQLRSVRYRIIGLIAAPPYGVTRVYQLLLNADDVPRRMPAL